MEVKLSITIFKPILFDFLIKTQQYLSYAFRFLVVAGVLTTKIGRSGAVTLYFLPLPVSLLVRRECVKQSVLAHSLVWEVGLGRTG